MALIQFLIVLSGLTAVILLLTGISYYVIAGMAGVMNFAFKYLPTESVYLLAVIVSIVGVAFIPAIFMFAEGCYKKLIR